MVKTAAEKTVEVADGSEGTGIDMDLLLVKEKEKLARDTNEFCQQNEFWRRFIEILREKMDWCETKWLDPETKPQDLKVAQIELLAYRSIETVLVDRAQADASEARRQYDQDRKMHPLLN